MIRRGNKYLNSNAKHMLYYGQIQSNLSYGISIWGPMLKKGQLQELFAVQRKCVNLIGSTTPFASHKIPTVHELVKLEQCKVRYKLCHNLLPVGLKRVMLTDYNQCSTIKTHCYQEE